ncbi:RipA family octameric membrane protein [Riemerella anatipestifer]|uniref:RipA family octameric membrane protein n=1 Tax=Riemerella anatipestifer TaxID=34085 RepID=UPI001BD9DC8D|nr:hypothetical protein [Riemerella anatipestifer]MDY3449799.1 hypothetical protein [Riemerella anatipestifer]QYR03378.1 hypothetical protein J6M00_02870 [Riemerella anatipestifer]
MKDARDKYKTAIDARDKLQENYHKWSNFYYVANAAILVAITQIYEKDSENTAIHLLACFGGVICFFWHLSCRGYYYWSVSWMKIIKNLEREAFRSPYLPYNEFEKENGRYFNFGFNISTPKLTIVFSILCSALWLIYGLAGLGLFEKFGVCCCFTIIVILLLLLLAVFPYVIPSKNAHSLQK